MYHKMIFFAAALDPRMKNNLSTSIMTDADHDILWQDILGLMVQKETSDQDARRDQYQAAAAACPQQERQRINMGQTIFQDFDQETDVQHDFERGQDNIQAACEMEMTNFRHGSIRQLLMKDDGTFNDPLQWWKERQHQFKVLAKLAREFLAIPAMHISTFGESMEPGISDINDEKSKARLRGGIKNYVCKGRCKSFISSFHRNYRRPSCKCNSSNNL